MNRLTRLVCAALLGCAASACTSWQHVETRERWTLYAKPGEQLDSAKLEHALESAFRAVESKLGAFERRVRINAWNEREVESDAPQLSSEGAERIEDVPGIGRARVRAYHVTGVANPFTATGVFLGTSEVGTVVHELVHARLAESRERVPLWFEEGLASLWGDGALYDGEWFIDGLACWPVRVLRDEQLSDAELARVLQLSATDEYSPRENLLVHFVGWALVFDLSRELPQSGHAAWLAHFRATAERRGLVAHARERIARSVSPETIEVWLEKLAHEDPGVRFAAAKGMWKLRNQRTVDALVAAMPQEADPQVRLALGLNALLAVGEMRVGRRTWRDIWRKVVPALGEIELEDAVERPALARFLAGLGQRRRSTQSSLDELARYWEE